MLWNGTQWVAEDSPTPTRRASRLAAWAASGLMVIGLVGVAVPVQLAAARTTSSVWVVELAGTTLSSQSPLQFGEPFTVGYSTNEKQPWALAQCYADDTTVLSGSPNADGTIWAEWYSVYPGGPSPQHFVLGESVAPIWTGGGAACTVTLAKLSGKYNGAQGFSKVTVLATTAFNVSP